MALFRFIDGLDIKVGRVGDPNEENLKKWVIERDLEYNFKRLKDIVEKMSLKFSNQYEQQLFIKNFFFDVKEKIKQKQSLSINELADQLNNFEEWEEYRMLLSYCYFISAQEGHFDLHSSVSEIEIEYKGGRCFNITLFSEKDKDELKRMEIYEVGKGTESVYDRLIGKNCYILKELKTGAKDLERILDKITIQLKNLSTGKRYGEPKIWEKGQK